MGLKQAEGGLDGLVDDGGLRRGVRQAAQAVGAGDAVLVGEGGDRQEAEGAPRREVLRDQGAGLGEAAPAPAAEIGAADQGVLQRLSVEGAGARLARDPRDVWDARDWVRDARRRAAAQRGPADEGGQSEGDVAARDAGHGSLRAAG